MAAGLVITNSPAMRGFLSLGAQGPDAGGLQTYDLTVPCGIAILIEPTENGYQIDCLGGSVDIQVERPGIRAAVISMGAAAASVMAGILPNYLATIGALYNDTGGGFPTALGRLIPDLVRPQDAPLLGSPGGGGTSLSVQVEFDEILLPPAPAAAPPPAPIIADFTGRPGAGLLIGPRRAAAVLIIAYRSSTSGRTVPVVGTQKVGSVLTGWVRGGALAPGQFIGASNTPTDPDLIAMARALSKTPATLTPGSGR
jgi:hypothetical protein